MLGEVIQTGVLSNHALPQVEASSTISLESHNKDHIRITRPQPQLGGSQSLFFIVPFESEDESIAGLPSWA